MSKYKCNTLQFNKPNSLPNRIFNDQANDCWVNCSLNIPLGLFSFHNVYILKTNNVTPVNRDGFLYYTKQNDRSLLCSSTCSFTRSAWNLLMLIILNRLYIRHNNIIYMKNILVTIDCLVCWVDKKPSANSLFIIFTNYNWYGIKVTSCLFTKKG